MTPVIESESQQHFDQVRRLTIAAFQASEFGHSGEAQLIDKIRDECEKTISLVAIDGDSVVGHILFSEAVIRTPKAEFHGVALAPMSVLPEQQCRGIGTMLVQHGLRCAADRGEKFAVVAGHPDFYQRIGFVPAHDKSIVHGFAGLPQSIFFVQSFDGFPLDEMKGGRVYYHSAFGSQYEH